MDGRINVAKPLALWRVAARPTLSEKPTLRKYSHATPH